MVTYSELETKQKKSFDFIKDGFDDYFFKIITDLLYSIPGRSKSRTPCSILMESI